MVHNIIIRGLNSIYLQAPTISNADEKAFLQYISVWQRFLHLHHSHEEDHLFDAIEQIVGEKNLMDDNVHQHHVFEAGVTEFKAFVDECLAGKRQYDAVEVIRIIDGFGSALVQHLQDEIPTLIALRRFGEEKGLQIEKLFAATSEQQMVGH